MSPIELVFGLLVAVAALTWLAQKLNVAYPILLVIGGLVLGFIPGLPRIELRPDVVFLLFLPPLLYYEAVEASLRDYRVNLRPIILLAVVLVVITIAAVAAIAHSLMGMSWAVAIVLGAIVGPTDETAALAIADRLKIPRRLTTIIEAESLFNDATALIIYRVALIAVVTGTFSWVFGIVHLVLDAAGGIAIGLAVAWLIAFVRARIDNPPLENTISLLSGFAAYYPADALHLSGVFAVIAAGLYLGRRSATLIPADTRLQNREMREVALFLINGLLFILVGFELHVILANSGGTPLPRLVEYGAIVSLAVIAVRVLWVFPATYVPRLLSRRIRQSDPAPPWQVPLVLSWTGMRGGVSLAAALAVPLSVSSGTPFPDRPLLLFLTFSVILTTLVIQGLTLPKLIELLGLKEDSEGKREERTARLRAKRAALDRLHELARETWADPDVVHDLHAHYQRSFDHYQVRGSGQEKPEDHLKADVHRRLRRELIAAERDALVKLRDDNIINDDTLRKVQEELDLDEVRYR